MAQSFTNRIRIGAGHHRPCACAHPRARRCPADSPVSAAMATAFMPCDGAVRPHAGIYR